MAGSVTPSLRWPPPERQARFRQMHLNVLLLLIRPTSDSHALLWYTGTDVAYAVPLLVGLAGAAEPILWRTGRCELTGCDWRTHGW